MMHPHHRFDAAAIKDAIDPYDFYLKELGLPRYGYQSGVWRVAGTCPFHDDRKAGSFKVNTETGAFKCWSCGASGGDIIAFRQQRNDLDFIDTLRTLTQDWRISSC